MVRIFLQIQKVVVEEVVLFSYDLNADLGGERVGYSRSSSRLRFLYGAGEPRVWTQMSFLSNLPS
jgi:hypothetical protein